MKTDYIPPTYPNGDTKEQLQARSIKNHEGWILNYFPQKADQCFCRIL